MTFLQKEEQNEFGQISLQVTAPKGSEITVTNLQTLTLTDLFVYVTSCFGTWFGLSVLSLRPSRLCRRRQVCSCRACGRRTALLRHEARLLRSQLAKRLACA